METAEGRGPGGILESRAFFSADVAAERGGEYGHSGEGHAACKRASLARYLVRRQKTILMLHLLAAAFMDQTL